MLRVLGLNVFVWAFVPGTHGGQKVLNPLGLELHMVESLCGCWKSSQHKEVMCKLVLTHKRANTGKNDIFMLRTGAPTAAGMLWLGA